MSSKIRKPHQTFTPAQKLEYAKLMVEENYTNQQVIDLSNAGSTAVSRWKQQFIAEQRGDVVDGKMALDTDKRRIQELEKQLAESRMDVALLKKATAFFIRDNPAFKVIRMMKQAENHLNLSHLCQLMDVPIASYYYRPVERAETVEYTEALMEIHKANFQAYGRRRMKIALNNQGTPLGVFKIARLMREAGISAKIPKKPHYYPSGKERPTIPNLLTRQFNPGEVNTHWVDDITYSRNHGGWRYLATVLDLGSREVVGYALSQIPDAQLARQALLNAIKMHRPDTHQCLFHSDQGVQYTADKFKKALSLHSINQSMSRRGNCWVNSVQERFFRSLKSEYLNGLIFINHVSVVSAVEHYIRYYNNKRIHSAIGNMTPVQKKQIFLRVA